MHFVLEYVLIKMTKNWVDARAYCVLGGGDLVSFSTKEEQDEALSIIGEAKGSWIGLNDLENEGKFEWSDGSKDVWRNHWKKGEPNGGKRENCVCFSFSQYPRWADISCSKKRSFICKYYA